MGIVYSKSPRWQLFDTIWRRRYFAFLLVFVFLVLVVLLLGGGAMAQDNPRGKAPAPALPGGAGVVQDSGVPPVTAVPNNRERAEEVLPYFRIGYVKPAEESIMNDQWYRGLEDALMDDQAFRDELGRLEMKGVVLRPCDDPEDMFKRLGLMEFDVAYAPAMLYARHRLSKPGEYNAVYMLRARVPQKFSLSPSLGRRPGFPRRRGVLFMRMGTELADAVISHHKDRIGVGIAQEQTVFAVSGTYDAAGYLYGVKLVAEEFDGAEPGQIIYSGSPQEVAKAVVCGLADVGVCDEGVLEEVLATIPGDGVRRDLKFNDFVKVYDKPTEWIPTDPVIFRRAYTPKGRGAKLGKIVQDILPRYHTLATPDGPLLHEAEDMYYNEMLRDMLKAGKGL